MEVNDCSSAEKKKQWSTLWTNKENRVSISNSQDAPTFLNTISASVSAMFIDGGREAWRST